MYDLLRFIDSPDVREYNKDTYFTPAEWSVIVGLSITQTVEDKIDALQYLADHYDGNDFEEESANMEPRTYGYKTTMPSRQVVLGTIRAWKGALEDRYRERGGIYAAKYAEKETYAEDLIDDYRLFHSYEKAFAFISAVREEHKKKKHEETGYYGQIIHLQIDQEGIRSVDGDWYLFDGSLRLIEIIPDTGRLILENGTEFTPVNEPEYPVYVPLPFQTGDILKIDSLRCRPGYGVMPCDWNPPKEDRLVHMWLPLEFYYEGITGDFDYADGGEHDVLRASFCPDEELPEDEQVLKLIGDVRRGIWISLRCYTNSAGMNWTIC